MISFVSWYLVWLRFPQNTYLIWFDIHDIPLHPRKAGLISQCLPDIYIYMYIYMCILVYLSTMSISGETHIFFNTLVFHGLESMSFLIKDPFNYIVWGKKSISYCLCYVSLDQKNIPIVCLSLPICGG